MPTLSWFPMPIYIDKVNGSQHEAIDKELFSVYDKVKFAQNPQWTGDTNELSLESRTDAFFGKHQLKDCTQFLDFLHINIMTYLQQIGSKDKVDYIVHNSWLTRTTKGKYIHMHDHGNYDISGVYYLQTNGKDGNLFFPSPHRLMAGNYIISRITDYTQSLPLEQGLLALWPSILYHNTAPNETDHERISASFNIKFI